MEVYDYYITPEEYDIAEKNNICRRKVNERVRKLGWIKRRAITERSRLTNDYSEWLPIIYKNGISRQTFYARLKSGWDINKAAITPVMTNEEVLNMMHDKRWKKVRKYPKEIVELAKSNGVSYPTFKFRVLYSKWDIMRAATTPLMTPKEIGLLAKEKTGKHIDNFYKLREAKYKEYCHKTNRLKE